MVSTNHLISTLSNTCSASNTSSSSSRPSIQAILTAEVDPGSACYVRFYHENFQRDKPDLLAQIKRATKTDQQAKDDVDSLRLEIYDLKGDLRSTVTEFDRKVAELSFEHNRHLAAVNAKYDKLSALVQSLMCAHAASLNGGASNGNSASLHQDTNQVTGSVAAMPPPACINYLHSLSEAAVSLQDECEWANTVATAKGSIGKGKRHAPENGGIGGRKKGASRLKR